MTGITRLRAPLALGLLISISPAVVAQEAKTPKPPTSVGDEVVVSASRVPLPAQETGSAVTVLTRQELEERGVRVVSDVLRDVPGLAVSRTGQVGAFTQIRMRGAEGNQTLVLVDGIEMNNPAGGSEFNMAHMMSADIARIEILRGPQSALYGSDAIGGVINIVTKTPGKGWSGLARAETGSFATRDGLTNIAYGGDRFFVTGTYNRYVTNGISEAKAVNGNHEADLYDNGTGHIKAGIQPLDNLKFEAVARQTNARRETDESVVKIGAQDDGSGNNFRERHGMVRGDLSLMGGNWTHAMRAAQSETGNDTLNASKQRTYLTHGTKTKYDYQTSVLFATPGMANAEHRVTLAAEQETDQQVSSGYGTTKSVTVVNRGYVGEYWIGLWDRLFLSGSLRWDDNDPLFKDELTWRGTAAYVHRPSNTRLHGSLGRGVKNPTLFELYGTTSTFTGNPNLRSERVLGMDAGVEQTFYEGALIGDVTYFRNRFEDYIDGTGNSAKNVAGTTKVDGLEFTVVAKPAEAFKLTANYTFTYSQDANGTELVRRARHIAGINGNYAFKIDGRKANANLGLRFNGQQDDIVYDSYSPTTVKHTERLNGFALLNFGFNWDYAENVRIFARGENLMDKKYQEVFGYGTPGRAVFAGLTVRFGPTSVR